MANKKFELLTDQFIEFAGRRLFRIRALISFGCVKAGEVGGYVEKESTLSADGDAWVYGGARVYGKARVYGDAQVSGKARVYASCRLVYGRTDSNAVTDFRAAICASLRVFPINGNYILYKRVNKEGEGRYSSCFDGSFKMRTARSPRRNQSTKTLKCLAARGSMLPIRCIGAKAIA